MLHEVIRERPILPKREDKTFTRQSSCEGDLAGFSAEWVWLQALLRYMCCTQTVHLGGWEVNSDLLPFLPLLPLRWDTLPNRRKRTSFKIQQVSSPFKMVIWILIWSIRKHKLEHK